MDINNTITNGTSNTYIYGSTASFYGFPFGNTGSTSGTNITYSIVGTTGMYTQNNLQGYYLISKPFSETLVAPGATSTEYTTTLTQHWYNINNGTQIGTTSTSQKFYYDTLTGKPSFDSSSSSSYSFNDGTTGKMFQVSGINVIGATAIFDLSINVNNLYNNFYVSPVLNYVFSGGCTTNTNVLNLSNYNNPTLNTFTLTGVTSTNISSSFQNSETLNATAYNLVGSTGSNINRLSSSSSAIYDKPSYLFIKDTVNNPTTIQEINSTNVTATGYRVWSNVDDVSVVNDLTNNINLVIPPYYTYNYNNITNNYSYSQFKYDQSWSIVSNATSITNPITGTIDTSQEIQIYDGHYGTGKTETNGTGINGYIDYRTYYNNQNGFNYSGVSRGNADYRYTTFVWRANITGNTPNYFVFTFKNIKVNGAPASLNGGSAPYSFQNTNNRFFLFYRTGEYADIETGTQNSSNSIWIDGNANGATINTSGTLSYDSFLARLTVNNYNDPYDNKTVRAPASCESIITSSNLQVKVSAIVFSNYNAYIYCRFGNSMSTTVTYESVSLTLIS